MVLNDPVTLGSSVVCIEENENLSEIDPEAANSDSAALFSC